MEHDHGPHASISDEADGLYRPLEGLDAWAGLAVDTAAWDRALDTLRRLRDDSPDWSAMVAHGARVAAAYQSGALDGVHRAKAAVGLALLAGEAGVAEVGEAALPHVRANHAAMAAAAAGEVSEALIRRVHEVACGPQATSPVEVDGRVQDHVLAAGDYKHHPNHLRTGAGTWEATAPVALVGAEMAGVVEAAGSPAFAALHPVVRAAYLHHALAHVQPFADGNGRVARALAGARLLGAGATPFLLLPDDVGGYLTARGPAETLAVVQRVAIGLAAVLDSLDHDGPAVDRWREREAAAGALRADLAAGLDAALARHAAGDRRRADLSGATVAGGEPLVVTVPPAGTTEIVAVDAHPLDDSPVSLTAREAGLRLAAGEPLDAWLDRVVSVLALRVAADLEDLELDRSPGAGVDGGTHLR